MGNIDSYRKRFYSLMESQMGDVKPLINEQSPVDSGQQEKRSGIGRAIDKAKEKIDDLKNKINGTDENPSNEPTKTQEQWEEEYNKGVQEIDGYYVGIGKSTSPSQSSALSWANSDSGFKINDFSKKRGTTQGYTQTVGQSCFLSPNKSYICYVKNKIKTSDVK